MGEKQVFEQEWKPSYLDVEDSGCARIYVVEDAEGKTTGMFVKLQSWDDMKVHEEFKQFEGKRVRVTVEALD